MKNEQQRRDYSSYIETLLDGYQVRMVGARYRSCCPLPTCNSENNLAFSITPEGLWKCFVCDQSGGMLQLLAKMHGVPYSQAEVLLASAPLVRGTMEGFKVGPLRPKEQRSYEIRPEAEVAAYRRYCPDYLVKRGFSRSILRKHEIGYDIHSARITIPIRDWEKYLVGMTYRLDFDDPSRPKYWHDNFNKSEHLYGFHFVAGVKLEAFALVEGQLDRARLDQLGIPAAAQMGSSLSDAQVQVMNKHLDTDMLILWYDNDDAGREAAKRAQKKLVSTRFGRNMHVAVYQEKDPGEMNERSKYTFEHWTRSLFDPAKRANRGFVAPRFAGTSARKANHGFSSR